MILATGGCCWRSGALGSNVDTGDGYLMAAEVGATLSGMEFSNYYGIVPVGGSIDKNGFYGAATFTDADGNVLASGFSDNRGVGGPRTWLLEAAPRRAGLRDLRPGARSRRARTCALRCRTSSSPSTATASTRSPQRFEIEYILEGTTRGYRRAAGRRRQLLDRGRRPLGRRGRRLARGRSSDPPVAPALRTRRSRSAPEPGRGALPPPTR